MKLLNCPWKGVFVRHRPCAQHQSVSRQARHGRERLLLTHHGSQTKIQEYFAAGDVQDHRYKQAVTAAGSAAWRD